MSLPINEINGLLNIVKEAAGHPTKLGSLGALAMKALESHNAAAKKEHDELLLKEKKEADEKRAAEIKKREAQAAADAKSAALTSRPAPVARPAAEFKAPEADEFEPDNTAPIKRREIPEEVE